jgi:CubicO group peptidase (beta-lactamase class C family)
VTDLVNYLAFLTHADHGDSVLAARYDGVLRRSTLAEMWRPVVPLASGSADESFGLSFYLYRRGRSTIVGHTGEQSGFRSFFFLDPSSTNAVVGVVNTTNEARPDSSLAAWDRLVHGAVDLVAR